MIEITAWTNTFLNALNDQFGDRVWFVGLQGSYARGEATENSDIDMVVILDEFVETFLGLKNSGAASFEMMSEVLFNWAKKWIKKIK